MEMAALARRLGILLATVLMTMGAMAPAASAASYEGELLVLMNAERAAIGLAPLSLHSDLNDDAALWSLYMFEVGDLSHNPSLAAVTTRWDSLGENVGVGPTIGSLQVAFMASAGHRGNILGDYDSVGIAVVEENPTKLWVTVIFMKTLDPTPVAVPTIDPVAYAGQQSASLTEQSVSGNAGAVPVPSPKRVTAVLWLKGRPLPI